MRRVVLKSPVLGNCTPGSVRGAPGNRRPYLAKMGCLVIFLSLIFLSAGVPCVSSQLANILEYCSAKRQSRN